MWKTELERWKRSLAERDPQAVQALEAMTAEEAEAAFSGSLTFGTGGLRAVLGMGPARMNRYTVARATQGLAQAILAGQAPRRAAIAYDTRHGSQEFAKVAASVLCANGINVVLWRQSVPTPLLSFTVRHMGLGWGVVITASHNPKQYNGYKVYDHRGVQAVPELAQSIMAQMERVEFFLNAQMPLKEAEEKGLLTQPEGVMEAYLKHLFRLLPRTALTGAQGASLPIVYSALYGSGAAPVSAMLKRQGFCAAHCIQMQPDPDFGGLSMPNPEDRRVYAQALEAAQRTGAALLLATDPDCDRVGVQALHQGGFVPLNGNQLGALLIAYLLETARERGETAKGRTLVTTIVSGELGQVIARSNGCAVEQVLTGFKYIGDAAERLQLEGKEFFFGYEESYGYLTGDAARDKDAVLAVALVAEMALYYARQGMDLYERYISLCQKYGYFAEATLSKPVPGLHYRDTIAQVMARVRGAGLRQFGGLPLCALEDFQQRRREDLETGQVLPLAIPQADVVKLIFPFGWLAVRPSGTEPNIKFYLSVSASSPTEAQARLTRLQQAVDAFLQESGVAS